MKDIQDHLNNFVGALQEGIKNGVPELMISEQRIYNTRVGRGPNGEAYVEFPLTLPEGCTAVVLDKLHTERDGKFITAGSMIGIIIPAEPGTIDWEDE